MKKNVFEKLNKAKRFWNDKTKDEQMLILKGMQQVFGGNVDSELENLVIVRLAKGEVSENFLNTIIEWSEDGKPPMLSAEFAD